MVYPIGRVLVGTVMASSLVTSSLPEGKIAPTIYLGSRTPQSDLTFQKLVLALAKRHPGLRALHPLVYVSYADDEPEQALESINRALKLRPAVLVAPTANAARFAGQVNGATPVVFASYQHPVLSHIVESMGPRSQSITGVSLADSLHAKRFEILREAFPQVRSIALLADKSWAESDDNAKIAVQAGVEMGIEVSLVLVETSEELSAAMDSVSASSYDAWYIPATYIAYLQEAQVLSNLHRLGKPSIHAKTTEVQSGALMAYTQDTGFVFDAMADLIARICNGERAGDIPIERPRRFVLSLRAQYDLGGARIAPAVVARADRVE